jgi:hypothetical protein
MVQSVCVDGVEDCELLPASADFDTNCNGIDDDCDGMVDEDYIPQTCGFGVCAAHSSCLEGSEHCETESPPSWVDSI